jgi:hypothetical protein
MFSRVLVFVLYCGVCIASERQHVCIHGQREEELTLGVRLSPEADHAAKREATDPGPIRFHPYFDDTVTSNPDSNKREMIQVSIIIVANYISASSGKYLFISSIYGCMNKGGTFC